MINLWINLRLEVDDIDKEGLGDRKLDCLGGFRRLVGGCGRVYLKVFRFSFIVFFLLVFECYF